MSALIEKTIKEIVPVNDDAICPEADYIIDSISELPELLSQYDL